MPDYIEVIIRSTIAFYFLLLVTRFLGKTQVSQLTYFDYIFGISVGTMAASISLDASKLMLLPVLGIIVWALNKFFVLRVAMISLPLRKLLEGEPSVVVKNGKLMEEAMNRSNYNLEDLMIQLRNLKIFDLNRVEEAVLEPNGKLSVLLKSQYQPITPKDLNISTAYQGMPQILVVDGNIAHHRLREIGLTEDWLKGELNNLNINDLSEVVVAQLNTNGQLFVDRRSDWDGWKIN